MRRHSGTPGGASQHPLCAQPAAFNCSPQNGGAYLVNRESV